MRQLVGEVGASSRILAYDKARTAPAVAGVFLAILFVFVQLGFFSALPSVVFGALYRGCRKPWSGC
jgi:hypothetical protein